MQFTTRRAIGLAAIILLAGAGARAQPGDDPIGDLLNSPPAVQPESVLQSVRRPLSATDVSAFRQALEAARRGDVNGARNAASLISDPLARKTATWVMVDAGSPQLGFAELDQARLDFAGWPRGARRVAAAERALETSGKSPAQIVAWFGGAEPQTPQGAMALASALRMQSQGPEAAAVIRRWWRDKSFEADVQRTMLARFGDVLTVDDHIRRTDILLYGSQGPASRDLIPMLPTEHQAAALARIALRGNANGANDAAANLPAGVANSPGVAFERASYLRRRGLDTLALAQVPNFPNEVATPDQAERIWDERHRLVLAALKNGDSQGAYAAAADSGLTTGADAAEAEFYAGWIALTRLKDPKRAARHFAALERIGSSPITRGRALYWEGRAAEAAGDERAARGFYSQAANHSTTFYGQLAAERIGQRLVADDDPPVTREDRLRFESMETVQAARLLYDQGQKDLYRVMVLHLDDVAPTVQDAALLVDLTRGYGDQDTSMKVVRASAQRGLILPGRGYPVRGASGTYAAEMPLVMGITRQESGFDPLVRSGAGARGMMQLMPATAAIVAKKIGVAYSPGMLDEPDYNMRLGSTFIGDLVSRFSGSYVMAIAGYNAGPGRPVQWSAYCGDPRGSSSDPVDFIECIPFSETRNYVMRVMENIQVYRAKLNGGSAAITLTHDLKRGSYSYTQAMAGAPGTSP